MGAGLRSRSALPCHIDRRATGPTKTCNLKTGVTKRKMTPGPSAAEILVPDFGRRKSARKTSSTDELLSAPALDADPFYLSVLTRLELASRSSQ